MRVLLLFLVTLTSGAAAEELDAMRLFFEPVKPELKVDQPVQRSVPPKILSYHYNGFISGDAGRLYFINGAALVDLKRVELISASQSGRTLELKTNTGFVFSLSIGETWVAGK